MICGSLTINQRYKMQKNDEYCVVCNDKKHYSVWPVLRPLPEGWVKEGMKGSKQQCLHHINQIWKGKRPLSLRC